MNVSRLENSKRLYELSGWKDQKDWWVQDPADSEQLNSRLESTYYPEEYSIRVAPAYDLGYLMRKLQSIHLKDTDTEHGIHLRYKTEREQWRMNISFVDGVGADTPEDAVVLLAIKLFEEGIL